MMRMIVRRHFICLLGVALLLALQPHATLAHDGQPLGPHDNLLRAWDPSLALALVGIALTYVRGVRLLWERAGVGRGVRRWQAGAFVGGMAALLLALASPLHRLSEALLAAHMVQHLVLIVVAAPLLVLGAPHTALIWALPQSLRRTVVRLARQQWLRSASSFVTNPAIATIVHVSALLVWHIPSLYEAALDNNLLHALEHGSFWGTALLWWWALLAPHGRLHYGAGIFAVFATAMISSVLGVFVALAPTLWYPVYAERAAPWGWTAVADQQLAGVLMWMPPGVVYLVAAGAMFVAWLRAVEQRVQQQEQRVQQAHASIPVSEGDVAL